MNAERRVNLEERVSVQVVHRFDVSPRRIFDAWTDPRRVRAWLATAPLALEVVELELKARAGQRIAARVRRGAWEASYAGEYVEVVAGQRLVFTWVDPVVSKETTLVTVGFQAIPSAWAATELTVDHARVLPPEADRTKRRWTVALAALASFLAQSPSLP